MRCKSSRAVAIVEDAIEGGYGTVVRDRRGLSTFRILEKITGKCHLVES
jgi:hypothetical protein